jgi:hypothetical protein
MGGRMYVFVLVILVLIGGCHGQGSEVTDQAALLAMKVQWTQGSLGTGWTSATLPCAGGWYE